MPNPLREKEDAIVTAAAQWMDANRVLATRLQAVEKVSAFAATARANEAEAKSRLLRLLRKDTTYIVDGVALVRVGDAIRVTTVVNKDSK